MALTPPKAPTAPQAPVPPSVDIGNSVPESTVEASGPAVPAGELETPASKFGIHIQLGGSEAVQPQFTEENQGNSNSNSNGQQEKAVPQTQNNAKNNTKSDTKTNAKDNTANQPPKEVTGQQMMQYLSGEDKDSENTATECSLKVSQQDDGLLAGFDNGHVTYWPFLLVFVVAFASFLIMHFMKKKENNDFGSLSYNKTPLKSENKPVKMSVAARNAYSENIPPAKPVAIRKVPVKKEAPKRFEVRI